MAKVSKKINHKIELLEDSKIVLKLWGYYKRFYQKEYETMDEDKDRLRKFTHNLKHIIRENVRFDKGIKSFRLHLNHFGDMDLPEFRKKMTGLKTDRSVYLKSLSIERRKRFLLDSLKKKIKKVKDKFNKKLHPEKDRTDDSGYEPNQPVTRTNKITKRSTTTASSQSTVDYRPYMNPIENQGQCG
jgi:hypothetical protein